MEHIEECPSTQTDNVVLDELLPCPWCGVKPILRKHFGVHDIYCASRSKYCEVQPRLQGKFAIANNAINAWNKRIKGD